MSEVARVAERISESCVDEKGHSDSEIRLSRAELRPLLEGARARGLADAFEMIGAGAVLIDETGAVLHLCAQAKRLLGGELRLAEGHLLAFDAASNKVFEQIVASVLGGAACEGVLGGSADLNCPRARLHIRALPVAGARDDHAQLLKAVLIVSTPDSAADAPLQANSPIERACAA